MRKYYYEEFTYDTRLNPAATPTVVKNLLDITDIFTEDGYNYIGLYYKCICSNDECSVDQYLKPRAGNDSGIYDYFCEILEFKTKADAKLWFEAR